MYGCVCVCISGCACVCVFLYMVYLYRYPSPFWLQVNWSLRPPHRFRQALCCQNAQLEYIYTLCIYMYIYIFIFMHILILIGLTRRLIGRCGRPIAFVKLCMYIHACMCIYVYICGCACVCVSIHGISLYIPIFFLIAGWSVAAAAPSRLSNALPPKRSTQASWAASAATDTSPATSGGDARWNTTLFLGQSHRPLHACVGAICDFLSLSLYMYIYLCIDR